MATDPYKYFRVEARELLEGLTQGVLEIERGATDRAMVGSLLRLAHTLKGASRVVKQPAMAELAHGVEDILSPFRDTEPSVPKAAARQMLLLLDQIRSGVAALDQVSENGPSVKRVVPEELQETVRVDLDEVEGVLSSLSEAAVLLTKAQNEAGTLIQARVLAEQLVQSASLTSNNTGEVRRRKFQPLAEELSSSIEHLRRRLVSATDKVQREIAVARERAFQLRLLPVRSIFPSLLRALRDASTILGKQARLETSGGEIRLDSQVLLAMRDALLQLVRNAAAHGLETPDVRAAAGKTPWGRVQVAIERRGNRVAFRCHDDGCGIDVAAIRRAAVKKGAVSPGAAESLGLREAIDLILQGGVTTTATLTEISGRGIGLDLVRDLTARLKGELSIQTVPGEGTTVEIEVPVSLTSVPTVLLASEGIHACLPFDCVGGIVRIADTDIVRGATKDFITYAGQTVPFFPISQLLKRPSKFQVKRWSVVIVVSGSARVAVGVDRVVGCETVMVRSLPEVAAATRLVAGVNLDAEGNPQLVFDPAGIVEAAEITTTMAGPATTARPLILVVDDSLTTRMVEQGILESAGYEVDVAKSGEEALERVRARPYGLFLVDVEMPGMDGFEFISRTREDPVLREIPAVLVTSRNSAEDRIRGEQAGARAHIVKSEFEQSHFLRTIRELVRY